MLWLLVARCSVSHFVEHLPQEDWKLVDFMTQALASALCLARCRSVLF